MGVLCFHMCRLAGDQRARRDTRHDSDAEDDDDVKKVRVKCLCVALFVFLGHHLGSYNVLSYLLFVVSVTCSSFLLLFFSERQLMLKTVVFLNVLQPPAGVAVVCSSYLQRENTPRPHSRSDYG